MWAVCISILVMLVAVAISKGYQEAVRNKLTGFNAHIQINHLDLNNSLQNLPIETDTHLVNVLKQQPSITHIQPFTTKAGIIKTDDAFEGIVLKGVDSCYDFNFIKEHLKTGRLLNLEEQHNEVLMSANTANKLGFKLNNDVIIYFIQDPPRVRKLKIVGIFDTGLGELDELYLFTDIRITQRLQNFKVNQITGYEVFAESFKILPTALDECRNIVPLTLNVLPINKIYPPLFDWLDLLDTNVWVIIILMLIVAIINMVTALLILIIERSNMVGILKALGSSNKQLKILFMQMALRIITRGLLLGNIIALILIFIQKYFQIIKLNPKDYYLNIVPVEISLGQILLLNTLALVVCVLTLWLPLNFVSKINPVKTIKFQ